MNNSTFEAVYCDGNPMETGTFEAVRMQARSYPFAYSKDVTGELAEAGEVWFAWNEAGLYVAASFEDSLLVSENRQDEQLHYQFGDLFELFVMPKNDTYCWEMYATPFGNKSTLFFPNEDLSISLDDLVHAHDYHDLEVVSTKTAAGWQTQMWVPITQLKRLGASWGMGSEWKAFCGRYNYNNRDLKDPELSMVPALSATNYHLVDEYAELTFLPKEN